MGYKFNQPLLKSMLVCMISGSLLTACGGASEQSASSNSQAELLVDPASVKINIAAGNVTASSTDAANVPANAVDGNLATHWTGAATSGTQWIKFNLGGCYTTDFTNISWYQGDARQYNFTVEASADGGSTWTTVKTATSAGTSAALVQTDFPNTAANVMRLSSTGSNVNTKVSVNDVEFWGKAGGTCSSSTTTTTTKVVTTTTAATTSTTAANTTTTIASKLSMLHASGKNIVDANGKVVLLRGFNLGGWFIMEKWMTPLDSGSLPDTYSVIQTLDNRFGVATEQSLIKTYQQSWMTTTDLDNIKNAGYNVIRVPVWWGQFYAINNPTNSGWRSDAFTMLDWVVNNAASRGLYVVIDMHGVIGGQSKNGDTGQANKNTYWTDGTQQGNTSWMWWQIASHYNGNTAVAGYDLINEPVGAPNTNAVWTAYDSLYKSVRSADPTHMIFLEGTFGSWNWSMLPPPSQYGWTNVVYEMHDYQYNGSAAKVKSGSDNQVTDFKNHASWNVPGYIGEFNDFGTGASTWQYSVNTYNTAGLSWSVWSYKASTGLLPDGWGWYDPLHWPTKPNISTDSAATISSDWQQWKTSTSFGVNTSIGLGAP